MDTQRDGGAPRDRGSDGRDVLPDVDRSPEAHAVGATRTSFALRDRLRGNRSMNLAWRVGVGVVGGLVLAAGIVMIPYPGPGWLVVFAGLAILSTEFTWAENVLRHAKSRYDGWNAWLKRQSPLVRAAVWTVTAVVVIVTLWLVGAYGVLAGWLGLDWPWVESPIL